ncbi:hypothetical protein TNCV_3855881 [Trichonephila clavipes]|nr:hypothetical protein TNCV_3855881 [Trichonephila clavipes]
MAGQENSSSGFRFCVGAVPILHVRSCPIFLDFHPIQVACPESAFSVSWRFKYSFNAIDGWPGIVHCFRNCPLLSRNFYTHPPLTGCGEIPHGKFLYESPLNGCGEIPSVGSVKVFPRFSEFSKRINFTSCRIARGVCPISCEIEGTANSPTPGFWSDGVQNKRERTRISSICSLPKLQHSDEISGILTRTALGPTDSSPQS